MNCDEEFVPRCPRAAYGPRYARMLVACRLAARALSVGWVCSTHGGRRRRGSRGGQSVGSFLRFVEGGKEKGKPVSLVSPGPTCTLLY
jgi:hypothetical protein